MPLREVAVKFELQKTEQGVKPSASPGGSSSNIEDDTFVFDRFFIPADHEVEKD